MNSEKLPSFDRPPVVETVLGVQFESLPKLRNAHLGAFWKSLVDYWKKSGVEPWVDLTDAPTLEASFERFGESQAWRPPGVQLKLTQAPPSRVQIRNPAGDRMIQLQDGRLHYNWVGCAGGPYPRYSKLRPEFDAILAEFRDFLAREGVEELRPNQWEVTYVNHIPKGSVWNEPQDWKDVFVGLPSVWGQPSSIQLESFGGEWHFVIAPQRGRLHIQLAHARAGSPEGEEVLRLNLTARGPIAEGADGGLSLSDGLDLGRQTIVRTFHEITSESAHQHWELRCDHG